MTHAPENWRIVDLLLRTGRIIVWLVQKHLDAIEHYVEPCAMRRFDSGAKMREQRLDFAPVDVRTGGLVVNGLE